VQCYDCVDACGPGDTRVTLAWPAPAVDTGTDLGRRQFLGLAGAGAAYGLLTVAGLDRRAWHDRLIRPPGAIVRDEQGQVLRLMTEAEFRDKCLRCGQCLKACPTGGLQPAVGEAGLDGFYTPILVPRAGWCEQSCEACGKVCPSGALIPFAAAEKVSIPIGLATITRDKCLAWREGDQYAQCVVCKEFCSYGAVELHRVGGQDRPYVRDYKCVGCGICESACPVKPEAAIVVHRRGTPDEL
jgi:ferredoxin